MTTITISQDMRQRVNTGATLLDQHEPGWASRIHTARLDLWSTADCVLGQLYGDGYNEGLAILLGDEAKAADHGFDTLGTGESYDALTYAWFQAIDERRA